MSLKLALPLALLLSACSAGGVDPSPDPSPADVAPITTNAVPAIAAEPRQAARAIHAAEPGRIQRTAAEVLASDDVDAFNEMAQARVAEDEALGQKKMECIRKGLALDPGMYGHVELEVQLNADGTVRATEVTSNRHLPLAVVACIRRAVAESTFAAPGTPSEFTRRESAGIP